MRGYSVVALDNPKTPVNIGSAIRAADCYDAVMVVVGGVRKTKIASSTDTMNGYRHRPVVRVEDVFDVLPYGCIPVAVDLVPTAESLVSYQHPSSAFYIFGAEDATLGDRILSRCRDHVMVPTRHCMNLAAAVNVVLYDRMAKEILK